MDGQCLASAAIAVVVGDLCWTVRTGGSFFVVWWLLLLFSLYRNCVLAAGLREVKSIEERNERKIEKKVHSNDTEIVCVCFESGAAVFTNSRLASASQRTVNQNWFSSSSSYFFFHFVVILWIMPMQQPTVDQLQMTVWIERRSRWPKPPSIRSSPDAPKLHHIAPFILSVNKIYETKRKGNTHTCWCVWVWACVGVCECVRASELSPRNQFDVQIACCVWQFVRPAGVPTR